MVKSRNMLNAGTVLGTFGSSSELSCRLDEFQFTFGEGPCLDSVRVARPVLVADLDDPAERRWPAWSGALIGVGVGVRAVYALPVASTAGFLGALDLFCHTPGALSNRRLTGGLIAAELAATPLMEVLSAQLGSLARVEVYQATGMIMGQLGVDADEALVRLRAYAFAADLTAGEVAWTVVDRRLDFGDESDAEIYDGRGDSS